MTNDEVDRLTRQRDAFVRGRHPNTGENDFRTPDYILRWLETTHQRPITLDGACSVNNQLAEPFDLFGDDALPNGSFLFVNPPWDTPTVVEFVNAAKTRWSESTDALIVFLLPNKLSEVKWSNHVNDRFSHITMLGGRVDFSGPFSVKRGASRWGCFLGTIGDGGTTLDSVTLRVMKSTHG
tara:strand:+ start:298 stop:840 length:543 start_codon:yes stop_codon:yes gene_type:complete